MQFLLHRQHRDLQHHARTLGLKLFGDLQVGLSPRDDWAAQAFLLRGYSMGAPPSRTNPEGQPWNHAVLDPAQFVEDGTDGTPRSGPALRLLQARMEKMFSELDGVRIGPSPRLRLPLGLPGRSARPDPGRPARGATLLVPRPARPPGARPPGPRPGGPARSGPLPSCRRLGESARRGAGGALFRPHRRHRRDGARAWGAALRTSRARFSPPSPILSGASWLATGWVVFG